MLVFPAGASAGNDRPLRRLDSAVRDRFSVNCPIGELPLAAQKETTMTRRLGFCLILVLAQALAVPAFAQVGKGLSGAHWNLNIIGVPKDKTVPSMTD